MAQFIHHRLHYSTLTAVALAVTLLAGGCSLTAERGRPESDVRVQAPASSVTAKADMTADLMYELIAGEIAGHAGDIEQAIDHYVMAAEISSDPRIAERATQIAVFGASNDKALDTARRWAELSPGNAEAERMLGVLCLRAGKTAESADHFERVLAADNKDGKGYFIVAATLAGEKDQKAAVQAMQSLVGRHSQDAQAYLALAGMSLQLRESQQAVEAADHALALDPKLAEARVLRARAYAADGDYERAASDMRDAARTSDNKEVRVTYAKLLIQARHYEDARREFQELLKESPNDGDLLYALGLLDLQEKHYDEAKRIFKRMLAEGERASESRFYLARTEEEQGNLKQAQAWYQQVEGGSYYVDAQIAIATVKTKLESLGAGREHLRELRRRTSEQETAIHYYLAEGELLRAAQDYKSGMDVLNEALQQFPGNTDLLYARALMAEKVDRLDVLEADLHSILKQDPENASALNALGFTLADRNQRVDEAMEYIQRALKARPDDPAVIDSMGWVLFRMGKYPESERFLRRAYSLMNDGEIAGHLSEVIWQAGRHDEARALIDKAIKKEPDQSYLRALHQRYSN